MKNSSRTSMSKNTWLLPANSIIATTALVVLLRSSAVGQWSADPTVNNAISTATGLQVAPTICSDGAGGAIIAWDDLRNGTDDIYAQRIGASGVVQWTADGVPISLAAGVQSTQAMVSDGVGGAIIVWQDMRGATNDIYAQRVNASGVVRWTTDGVAISAATGEQYSPVIASDGAGGAIISWYDTRSGTNDDIYAQRIDSTGAVKWTTDGIVISSATGDQTFPKIIADGKGGAIITWQDRRNGNYDIYAQRVNSAGSVRWTANGVVISSATGNQTAAAITGDGAAGAIIAWQDLRTTVNDIYAQRVDSTGTVQWTANGVVVSAAWNHQQAPVITSDGNGGAIIAWQDWRSDVNIEIFTIYEDIYAQRIDATGTVQWTADGVAISTASDAQANTAIVSDGTGGAIVTWQDHRNGTDNDVFAQRIDNGGTVQWTSDGVALSTAAGNQTNPVCTSDSSGGAIITWFDSRGTDLDIYAVRVSSNSALPVEMRSFTVTAHSSGAELHWTSVTESQNHGFEVERKQITNSKSAIGNLEWLSVGFVQGHGTSSSPHDYTFIDHNVDPGHYVYRIKQVNTDGSFKYTQELQVEIGLIPRQLTLSQNYPNPFNPTTTIRFSNPQHSNVLLVVFDILGREVATLVNGELDAGYHQVELDASRLSSGIYFYRIQAGSFTATKRLVLLK